MKAAFWAMCGVLAVSLAVCAFSIWFHGDVLDELNGLCTRAIEYVRADDGDAAAEYVNYIENLFESRRTALEMLASHNDLHETAACIVDARVALECGDIDDAYQALVQLEGMLEHLREHESLSVSNLM